jgi:hypothetical protein
VVWQEVVPLGAYGTALTSTFTSVATATVR